ncbi:hypothetical protein IQ238_09355 [Pleurocapsales cyanobacterium LEGE 06147]|nr:hypothetical protein [Pleurocapsales cyanobacterium LEGE 06147]
MGQPSTFRQSLSVRRYSRFNSSRFKDKVTEDLASVKSQYAIPEKLATCHTAIAVSIVLLILLVGLPLTIRKYNWFGLRDIIRVE